MKLRVWKVVGLLVVIAAVVVAFLYWNSPARRIRAVLSDGEAAIEAKDLDRAMSHVSLHYQDENGFNFLTVKELLKRVFEQFEGCDVRLANIAVDIHDERAVVRADLEVLVIHQGEKAYLIGSGEKPALVRITFTKDMLRWQVRSVDGLRLPLARE